MAETLQVSGLMYEKLDVVYDKGTSEEIRVGTVLTVPIDR